MNVYEILCPECGCLIVTTQAFIPRGCADHKNNPLCDYCEVREANAEFPNEALCTHCEDEVRE